MKKRTLLLTLPAILLVFSILLSACGENIKSGEASEIEIKFPSIWVAKDSKAASFAQIVKDFNEQNQGKIKVVVEEIPDYGAYKDKIRTNITTGTTPDIFSFDNPADGEFYYKSGNLADLTPYLDEQWKSTFLDHAFDNAAYDGKVYSIPFEFGVTPVLYNTKLFKQAGITGFPKTYTELFAAYDKLKAAGIAPATQMTGGDGWVSMLWYSQLVSAIGGPDVYKHGLDDPAFVQAAEVLKKLFDYTTGDAVGLDNAGGHFLNQQTAVLLNGPWFIGRIKKEGIDHLYDSVEVAPAPVYEGGKGQAGQYIGFTQASLAVGKQKDKKKEEAIVKFLKYLTSPDNVKKISLDSGSLFVIKYDVTKDDNVERLQTEMKKGMEAAPYIIPHFRASVSPAVGAEFPQALSGLVLGKYTPEQFVEQLKQADSK
ncbi:ABC transporter substrate-binding protein [Paenibacillus sp. URB8-2]|uniref:ABC transporter substrate-binding protein n=1 Tax=Paenibacillus sp. URB8-2 TaxID=2741301 RepID=UPI0015C0043F|nr:ABC transporter substrate-binding protein [Paenibacillus sp. URB8-2]BCG60177.1 ABC transporter substrate-binding protein [Paenibacillus sp. URB8-2]